MIFNHIKQPNDLEMMDDLTITCNDKTPFVG